MERRSESFGRLLKAGTAGIAYIEGKTQQAVETELGTRIGVAGVTLQRYKAGYIPPEPRSIEQLADACVQRGLMGRLWLERFLSAARYSVHGSRALIGRIFPDLPVAQARMIKPNLPPPTYTRFIMRSAAYKAVIEGLSSELPVTMVISLGGMGKTSLARAVAGNCLEGNNGEPTFETTVWISDKDRPGTTNLSTTLDEIARVLDYPGLTGLPFVERQREVEELLRRQSVLLVIDNAETVTDRALLEWLTRLPGLSKALITSRIALPFLSNTYLVELGPMSANETRALIAEWLPRSRLRLLPGALDQLMPLAKITGGNPKALELAIGLLQHRSLESVMAELHGTGSRLLDELFRHAWILLDDAARRVLLSLPLFPASAATDALAYCADLSSGAFIRSAEQLVGLSLLDIERSDLSTAPRYNAHPLVRAYAHARFEDLSSVEQSRFHERWMCWCSDTALAVGFCWKNLDLLNTLDHEYAAVQAAIRWASEHQRYRDVIILVEGVRYYYNVRGLWSDEELRNHERRAIASHQLGDTYNEILALAHYIEVLSKQGRVMEAVSISHRMIAIGEEFYRNHLLSRLNVGGGDSNDSVIPNDGDDAAFEYGHALALLARAQHDYVAAELHWRQLLGLSRILGGQKYVVNLRWLAIVLLQHGDIGSARELFSSSLEEAQRINDIRSVVGNMLKLAAIDLQFGEVASVTDALEQCQDIAMRYRDRRRLAECHWMRARLYRHRGDNDSAIAELRSALDMYERLGMQSEAIEAQAMNE